MFIIKHLRGIISLITGILMSQTYGQPANLVLQDTTIATAATFTARNSITAGPNFKIAASGDATFVTGGYIYFRPGIVIIQGGKLQTIRDSTLVEILTPEAPVIPAGFKVQQNYPNPFNPTTQIGYELPTNEKITIVVYNTSGQSIRKLISQNQHAGYHHVIWDARNDAGEKVSSGIYYYLVKAGNYAAIKKMVLLK